jgi:hypothetical protein
MCLHKRNRTFHRRRCMSPGHADHRPQLPNNKTQEFIQYNWGVQELPQGGAYQFSGLPDAPSWPRF